MDSYNLQEEFYACLALKYTAGLGAKSWALILREYDSAYEGLKDASNWHDKKLASEASVQSALNEEWRQKASEEYKSALKCGFGILPWTHPSYPNLLKQIPDPPPFLYYYGDPSLLNNSAIGVVGSRACSNLGLEYGRRFGKGLASKGITVVSGFARGIDSCAHSEAVNEVGSTIAVLGTGLDVVDYPTDSSALRNQIIDKGLILSEFPPGTRPYAGNFPFRNRIISGISLGIVVAEASVKSGSLITARLAAEQGREVMALPGPVGSSNFSGCLKLIKEGAALIETVDDVLVTLSGRLNSFHAVKAPVAKPQSSVETSFKSSSKVKKIVDISFLKGDDLKVAEFLKQEGKSHIDEIARNTALDVSVVGVALLGLEVQGIVERFAGMYYSLKNESL